MATAKVYRPERSWKGDRGQTDLEDWYIGDVTGVIVGGAAPQPLARFPNVVSTEGQIGVPYAQDSGITLQQNDIVFITNRKYLVQGPRMWEEESIFAGAGTSVVDDYYWVEVRSTA